MSIICLKDIWLFVNYGCLIEEEKIGSDYLVNFIVKVNLVIVFEIDKFSDIVDYVYLNKIVKE